MRNLVLFVATGAGSGFAPIASGTVGAGVGVILYAALALGLGAGPVALLGCTIGIALVGLWAAERAEQIFETKDDGRITIDEIAGQFVSLLWLPLRPEVWLAGFLLFRLFDIWKPPPVRAAERMAGGAGVMIDDLLAGLYANLCGQLLWRVLLPGGLL